MSLWREPLIHFVVAGSILFGAFALLDRGTDNDDAGTIVVDRRALLTFLQYRANAFEPETFGAALDAMTDEELDEVIDAYVREEILYREAEALGLEESDNVIRQRMVQKMNFLVADLAAVDQAPDPEALRSYFEDNIETYAIEPWATFTHVFFDAESRGMDDARRLAESALQELNDNGAGFNDAPQYGDRFPYLRNYVERTLEYIASHFGYAFVAELETLEPSDTLWQGPIESPFGQHLVLLTRRVERAYPAFDDVRSDVERDLREALATESLEAMTESLGERYQVRVLDIRSGPDQ